MDIQRITNQKEVYSEVLEILSYMERKYVEKVPEKVMEFFQENSLSDYKFHITPEKKLKSQKINHDTLVTLVILNINYWCESEEEKNELLQKYADNDRKYQQELREKYNPENIFKKKDIINVTEEEEEQINDLLIHDDQRWYNKIYDSIKKIIKKLLNKD